MARVGKIRIGMVVLDRTGAVIGVVKAMELDEGTKPAHNLVLGEPQSQAMLQTDAPQVPRIDRRTRRGHLLIEGSDGTEITQPLESVDRVASTAVHLAVDRPIGTTDEGSLEGV